MTKREFLNAVINSEIAEDIKIYAIEEIQKMDARNDARKNTMSEKQIENETIKERIAEYLHTVDEPITAAAVAEALNITPGKASSLCSAMARDGVLTSEKVKGKSGKVNGYKIA